MASVLAGQSITLLSQWYAYTDGPLNDLDAAPSIEIADVGSGTVIVGPTTVGVTHPGTGSYGYPWSTSSTLAAGTYLVTWTGTKSASPVTATETVTVTGTATAPSATGGAWVMYTTREAVKRALMIAETARNSAEIDRSILSASRLVEGLTHRTFYPLYDTKQFDWPNIQGALPWRLWLDNMDIISVTVVSSTGGGVIPASAIFLEPNGTGPPYSRIEINLSSGSAFGGGSTYQQSILVTGLWGYSNDETTVGLLTGAVDASQSTVDVTAGASSLLGVGSIIHVDDERMIVTGRSQLDTTTTLTAPVSNAVNVTGIPVSDGTLFTVDEILLVDAEKMLITDIAGNSLLVQRAFDGTTIAAHSANAAVYAPRRLAVQRGALGTTAASHTAGSVVDRWDPPSAIQEYVTAFAISDLMEEQTGWFRTMSASSSAGGAARRPATMVALQDLVTRVDRQYTRKARQRAV